MQNSHLLRLRQSAIPVMVAGLLAVVFPVKPATAFFLDAFESSPYRTDPDDYRICASELLGLGLTEERVSEACAAALYPRDLSECVTAIDGDTAIESGEALEGCRLVRRPVDLAECVLQIGESASTGTVALDVLNYCRRSLLPLRFSACVVGLQEEIPYSTAEAMTDCIAAIRRPRNVLPSFVPIEEGIPSTPSSVDSEPLFPDDLTP